MIVSVYLVSIIAANLFAARFGPAVTPLVAFVCIGADLVLRDKLHESWQGRQLPLRMTALIATGSLLSWLLNRTAGPVALASCLAFAAAAVIDSLTYHALRRQPYLVRVNGSNVPSAIVDSCVFLFVAFGPAALVLAPLQVIAKIGGGAAWSVALSRHRREVAV